VFPDLEPAEPAVPQRRGPRPFSQIRLPRLIEPGARAMPAAVPVTKPQPRPAAEGRLRATVLSFANMASHGDLLVTYLRARRSVFIDALKWDLPQEDGMEFDQYDTPQCRWAVIHEYGEVLAGVRLLPTTARCGIYSYMLRDAQLGLLKNIPNDVLFFGAPVEQRVWEASRLFVTDAVPAHRRQAVQEQLMHQMSRIARDNGASHVIGIVPAVFARWLRRLGLGAVPVGPKFSIDGTSSQAALFSATQKYLN
jgi:N-acyl-L-homoserine lactone synthetase